MSDNENSGVHIRNLNRDEYERAKADLHRNEKREERNKERELQGLPPIEFSKPTAPSEEPQKVITSRPAKLKLDVTLGKTQVVHAASTSRQPGFYCEACDLTLKDSVNYVDHINGKKHQMAAGIVFKVERSTLEQVKRKLQEMKEKKQAPKEYDLDERVALALKKEEEEKELKKKRKLEKKLAKKAKQDEEHNMVVDEEAAKVMGFSGFGNANR